MRRLFSFFVQLSLVCFFPIVNLNGKMRFFQEIHDLIENQIVKKKATEHYPKEIAGFFFDINLSFSIKEILFDSA